MSIQPFTDKLHELRALKEAGEDYVECPRCDGSRYEYAVPAAHIDDYRPQQEEYPCPLCVTVATIDVDKAIEWTKEKAKYDEGYDENEENEDDAE